MLLVLPIADLQIRLLQNWLFDLRKLFFYKFACSKNNRHQRHKYIYLYKFCSKSPAEFEPKQLNITNNEISARIMRSIAQHQTQVIYRTYPNLRARYIWFRSRSSQLHSVLLLACVWLLKLTWRVCVKQLIKLYWWFWFEATISDWILKMCFYLHTHLSIDNCWHVQGIIIV